MDNHRPKGRIVKQIKDMSFREQCEALSKDPRFKELVNDIRQLSPERQDALDAELAEMND